MHRRIGMARPDRASPKKPLRPKRRPGTSSPMTMHKHRVSIGLIVYNGEEFLERALDSYLAQTYADFELVISDNASTDRSGEIGRAYAAKDHRIRYSRNEKNL